MNKKALLIIFLFFFASTAAAEVYKWVDAGGAVHFASTPPETGQVEKKEYDAPAQSAETIRDRDHRDEAQRQKQAAADKLAGQNARKKESPPDPMTQALAKKAAIRAENPQLFDRLCTEARATVKRIDNNIANGRVASYDPDAVMDKSFAKNNISVYCP